jgi:hypothetical protein
MNQKVDLSVLSLLFDVLILSIGSLSYVGIIISSYFASHPWSS